MVSILTVTACFSFENRAESLRAPSYFSQFFEEQLRQTENGGTVRTLYIDRDPVTFSEICRHLQGTTSAEALISVADYAQATMSGLRTGRSL